MDRRRKTKTFGLRTPTDLHYKLLFDIERLRSARSSAEARYAAFDCAVDAWHLVDWTLHAVDEAAHERLSGRSHAGKSNPKEPRLTIEASFAEKQRDRLPNLQLCHMLANSVKHREIRRDLEPTLWSGSTNILSWSEPAIETGERSINAVTRFTYIELDDNKYNAVDLFDEMAKQWQTFLIEEGLFEPRPDSPDEE